MKKVILAWTMLVVTANAQAVGWLSTPVSITNYYTTTTGYLYLVTSPMSNPDGCSLGTTWLQVTDTTYKFVVATVISAQATGQTVNLYYNGCSGGGTTGYPIIFAVAVPNS
ncbi:MAG TPA: hypothetical protein VNX02_11165 [Steroidobacteraceae bacterium]|jgi:hypothetical protein|nr:hypothetical protein [Steroidobacteraceae bacterium]